MIKLKWGMAIFLLGVLLMPSCAQKTEKPADKAKVSRGSLTASIPSSGVVEPRNRVEIKPPVAGRVEAVLVQEGDKVKKGQTLAWMSSADRAALLDAARSKGNAEVRYWEGVYKQAPIIAPLNGFIIQRAVEAGQSVTAADALLVMADRLILKAQVDETDLGNIKTGQSVTIVMDAYPNKPLGGSVERIAYESKLINNVNIYEVFIIPQTTPEFLRSGMSATINFFQQERSGVLLLPIKAVKMKSNISYVFITDSSGNVKSKQIKTGLETNDKIEVISGISEGTEVTIPTAKMIKDFTDDGHRPMGLPGMQRQGR